jgi:hypothetical protein
MIIKGKFILLFYQYIDEILFFIKLIKIVKNLNAYKKQKRKRYEYDIHYIDVIYTYDALKNTCEKLCSLAFVVIHYNYRSYYSNFYHYLYYYRNDD